MASFFLFFQLMWKKLKEDAMLLLNRIGHSAHKNDKLKLIELVSQSVDMILALQYAKLTSFKDFHNVVRADSFPQPNPSSELALNTNFS